jgi:hypothetical protein
VASPRDELLAAVDVVRGACHGRVRHQVNGERRDVSGADHSPDRQRLAELLATSVELVAEKRCRERRVDEAGGDQVDANGSELEREREVPRQCRPPPP